MSVEERTVPCGALLVRLLENPRGVFVVERMMDSRRSTQAGHDGQQGSLDGGTRGGSRKNCKHCDFRICMINPTKVDQVWDLQWNFLLTYLLSPSLEVIAEGSSVKEVPRFCVLSPTVQHNVLILLERQKQRICLHSLESFVNVLENCLHNDSMSYFLLRKLKLSVKYEVESRAKSGPPDPAPNFDSALPERMLKKVSDLSLRFAGSLGEPAAITTYQESGTPHYSPPALPVEEMQLQETVPEPGGEHSELIEDSDSASQSPPPKRTKTCDNELTRLPPELLANTRQVKDSWLKGEAASEDMFSSLLCCNSETLEAALDLAGVNDLPEGGVVAAVMNLSSPSDHGYQNMLVVVKMVVLPHLVGLRCCASRILRSAFLSLVEKHFSVSADGLLLPLLKSQEFGPAQTDLLVKLLKEVMTADQKETFWKKFIASQNEDSPAWNDEVITVLQALVEQKDRMDSGDSHLLLRALQRNASHLEKSSVFAKLLIKLVNKYHQSLSPIASSLNEIAATHKSMLRTSLIRAIKRLQ